MDITSPFSKTKAWLDPSVSCLTYAYLFHGSPAATRRFRHGYARPLSAPVPVLASPRQWQGERVNELISIANYMQRQCAV